MSRELLEKAAKAAGMKLTDNGVRDVGEWEYIFGGDTSWGLFRNNANGTQRKWNPLTDDGDAFRLAVKLGILNLDDALVNSDHSIDFQDDPYAATRLAIVRAAAAIGAKP
jgi:hypothetical protein